MALIKYESKTISPARLAVMEEAEAKGTEVAIIDRTAEAFAFFAEESRHVTRSWGGAETNNYSEGGRNAGSAAASLANYGTEERLKGSRGALGA